MVCPESSPVQKLSSNAVNDLYYSMLAWKICHAHMELHSGNGVGGYRHVLCRGSTASITH